MKLNKRKIKNKNIETSISEDSELSPVTYSHIEPVSSVAKSSKFRRLENDEIILPGDVFKYSHWGLYDPYSIIDKNKKASGYHFINSTVNEAVLKFTYGNNYPIFFRKEKIIKKYVRGM